MQLAKRSLQHVPMRCTVPKATAIGRASPARPNTSSGFARNLRTRFTVQAAADNEYHREPPPPAVGSIYEFSDKPCAVIVRYNRTVAIACIMAALSILLVYGPVLADVLLPHSH